MYYAFLIASAFLTAGQFIFLKLYQKAQGESVFGAALFSVFVGVTQMIFTFAINGFKMSFSVFSLVCALIMAALVITSNVLGVRVMKMGKLSVYTLFLMSGGMVIPFLYGVMFLNEQPKAIHFVSLLLIMISLFIPAFEKTGKKKSSKLFYALCCVLFCVNGAVSSTIKTHQIGKNAVNTFEFLFLIAMFQTVISLIITFSSSTKETPLDVIKKKKPLLFGVGFGLVNGFASLLQFASASHINASVQYPILTGGSIVFSALLGYLVFKEKISRLTTLSIAVAFLATCLFIL